MKKLITATILSFASGVTSAESKTEDIYIPKIKNVKALSQLDKYFSQLTKHDQFIGSVAIYHDGKPYYQYNATLNNGAVAATHEEFKYRIGSITKTFTSVMILQLIEEGKLSLNTKLSSFYPDVVNAEDITIAQLLNHSSGVKSFTDDPKFIEIYASPQTSSTLITMIEGYDSLFTPGSKGEYSNSNYYLLGHILEQVTKQTYQENLSVRITEKLQLKNTYYGGAIRPEHNEVSSYYFVEGRWLKSVESDMSVPHGAGAMVSSTKDLNQFIQALFNEQLISKDSLASMLEIEHGYGKGIFKQSHDNRASYSHNGRIDHFDSLLAYEPETKMSIAILNNGLEIGHATIVDAAIMASKGELVELPNFDYIKVPVEQLALLTGEYTSETHDKDIKIIVEGDELYAQATGQGAFPLSAFSSTNFTFLRANITMDFDVKKASFTIKQGGRLDTFVRVNKLADNINVPIDVLTSYNGLYTSPDFPLDVKIFVENGALQGQATGQGAFPLTPRTLTSFSFASAGIVITFDNEMSQLTLSQGGRNILMTKS